MWTSVKILVTCSIATSTVVIFCMVHSIIVNVHPSDHVVLHSVTVVRNNNSHHHNNNDNRPNSFDNTTTTPTISTLEDRDRIIIDECQLFTTWSPWNETTNTSRIGWCPLLHRKEMDDTPAISGFIFVKVPKAASSTGAAISIRIAHNVASRQRKAVHNSNTTTGGVSVTNNDDACPYSIHHGFAYTQ